MHSCDPLPSIGREKEADQIHCVVPSLDVLLSFQAFLLLTLSLTHTPAECHVCQDDVNAKQARINVQSLGLERKR